MTNATVRVDDTTNTFLLFDETCFEQRGNTDETCEDVLNRINVTSHIREHNGNISLLHKKTGRLVFQQKYLPHKFSANIYPRLHMHEQIKFVT